MSALTSSPVLRGVHLPVPSLPRFPELRLVGGPTRRPVRSAPTVVPSPAGPPARRDCPAPLRLTRRGRHALALAVLAGVGVPVLSGHVAAGTGTPLQALAPVPALAPALASASADRVTVDAGRAPWSAGSAEAERVAAGLVAAPAGWTVVTALPGDSLWAIARRSAPQVDRRQVVARIVARNGLVGTDVTAGDALLVPAA